MADGQSTGPAATPPVSPAESVVQPGSFDLYLSPDIETLHLANNHVIKSLVEEFNGAVASQLAVMAEITEQVQEDIVTTAEDMEHFQSLPPERQELVRQMQERVSFPAIDEMTDIQNTRDFNAARDEIAQLSDQLEADIEGELQRVADAFHELATLMNGSNTTAQGIRDDINRVDAEVVPLEAELDLFTPILIEAERLRTSQGSDAQWDYVRAALPRLDEAGIIRESNAPEITGPLTWAGLIHHPATALSELNIKREALIRRIEFLGEEYPEVYKNYTKLLDGFSLSERSIDWWKIGSTMMSWAIEEAIWIAAGIVLAPVTGGIATALIASTRMVARAGRIGAAVARGLTASGRAIVWLYQLPDRVTDFAINVFRNAWRRVRVRVTASRGQPGSQIDGNGQSPDAPTCPIGACVF